VQLHTHPVQRRADYLSRGARPAADDIAAYPPARQTELLEEGRDILVDCGLAREKVLAFRAGNFGASNETWGALRRAGFVVSSNYNPCYFGKNCRMRTNASRAGLFDAGEGVWELPISNFREASGTRHLQITAVSLAEMKDYLAQAAALGIGEVTIVTHSFEFCHIDSIARKKGRVNAVNLWRLRGLCRFLAANRSAFVVETVGALAERLAAGDVPTPGGRDLPRGRRVLRARRQIEQAYKRLEARVHFTSPATTRI
jgi:hypothetical protein